MADSKIAAGAGSDQIDKAKQIWQHADAVCFDVDSTVVQEEGIDVLADFCGVGERVAEFTRSAMNGAVLFQDALKARLDLIKPSKKQIEQCLQHRPFKLTPGISALITSLQRRRVPVYLVSGGFRQMIEPILITLQLPAAHLFANRILFNNDGAYSGFDENEPTSRSGGKAKVLDALLQQHHYKRLVMVGDGITDMEARPPAHLFIGFGGVVVREKVRAGADWFVTDFQDLIQPIADADVVGVQVKTAQQ